MRIPLVYKEGPVFGCDIGSQAVKIIELSGNARSPKVVGYGSAGFDPKTIVQGIIADPEQLAKTIEKLLLSPQMGKLKADRAALSIPVSRVFIRTLQLPAMSAKDVEQAIHLEIEQYVPVPINDLYIDYQVIKTTQGKEPGIEIQAIAAPRAIVDSYIKLFDILGIFVETIEVSLNSILRAMAEPTGATMLLIDFGSESADLVINEETIKLSATIPIGGITLTKALVDSLGVTPDQADEIKQKFGIAVSGLQGNILKALQPSLDTLVSEIKKAIKYHKDRSQSQGEIRQIILSGGSSLMPGMMEYLSKGLGLQIVVGNPWRKLDLKKLASPGKGQQAMYATAIGLALLGVEP